MQDHDYILLFHRYIQACELVCEGFYLVDVVKDVVAFVHFYGKELTPHEQDIGQTFGLVNVT